MPVVSRAQARFMGAVASGRIKAKGLSEKKAHEFLSSTKNIKRLPVKK